jgi:hypothetical protein
MTYQLSLKSVKSLPKRAEDSPCPAPHSPTPSTCQTSSLGIPLSLSTNAPHFPSTDYSSNPNTLFPNAINSASLPGPATNVTPNGMSLWFLLFHDTCLNGTVTAHRSSELTKCVNVPSRALRAKGSASISATVGWHVVEGRTRTSMPLSWSEEEERNEESKNEETGTAVRNSRCAAALCAWRRWMLVQARSAVAVQI